MKKAVFLSHSLITAVLRELCSNIANLFDNSLTPTTEQIEDLHEITRAWLADMPDSYQEKFNNGFSAGFEMAQQLTELDAVATEAGSATFEPRETVNGFSMTFNVDEDVDETPRAEPEPEEDPFRYHVTAVEITGGFTLPVMDLSGVNSPEIPVSSNDSEAGDSNPTNLINKPVEKNSQPYKERANLNKRRAEAAGLTTEHLLKAIETHGIDALASFCGITPTTAKAAVSKAEVYGYPGPKCCDWLRSLKEAEPAEIAAPEKSEKLTEPQPQPKPEPQPEPKKTGPTQVISFGRARELCRTGKGTTDLERRFISAFNDSGLDAATFIATLQELHGMAVIP